MSGLAIWVVYDNPLDYPGMVVVRRWDPITGPSEDCDVYGHLWSAHADLQARSLVRLGRFPDDDPAIESAWI